jgi:hypothetical protein
MRRWKSLVVAAVVAVVGLAVVAAAVGQTGDRDVSPRRAACGALMGDPAALKAMRELRAEHRAELQAWRDKYGDDPGASDAKTALQKLREEHRRDMRALLERFGVEVPDGAGSGMMGGRGAGCGSGCGAGGASGAGYGGMMGAGYGAAMMRGTY